MIETGSLLYVHKAYSYIGDPTGADANFTVEVNQVRWKKQHKMITLHAITNFGDGNFMFPQVVPSAQ